MTARQPPGEKGAKACTIGCDSSRDGYFCAYFSGEMVQKELGAMSKGARYVVTTHWGTFSLDEGSYQDYLAGKLWISWVPGAKNQVEDRHPDKDAIPPHTSQRALELRDAADKRGVWDTLASIGKNNVAHPPFVERLSNVSIEELSLTVRSCNGLMRAQANTFGKLNTLMRSEHGVTSVRNLGLKSAKEIRDVFFEESYRRMLPYERAQYWQEVIDLT